MRQYEGSIEDVLASGEYDQGDYVVVSYDELADLVQQAKTFADFWIETTDAFGKNLGFKSIGAELKTKDLIAQERRWNRPLHPCLGGKSPYSEFLSL